MKNFLSIACFSLLLACNSAEPRQSHHNKTGDTLSSHQQTEHTSGLVLNNNAKWQADSATIANVSVLQLTAAAFDQLGPDLAAYQQLAASLQTGLNKMIKECRMKGADHDTLHQWLEPLLSQVKQLTAATTATEAHSVFEKVSRQLALFNQYFEG